MKINITQAIEIPDPGFIVLMGTTLVDPSRGIEEEVEIRISREAFFSIQGAVRWEQNRKGP